MVKEAIFAAGCFWGVEEKFSKVNGVVETKVGYTGGNTNSPKYEDVCSGDTNHAEAIFVKYEDEKISYEDLVRFFFKIHNPTTQNRQGVDVGSQYRSSVFYLDEEQKKIAEMVKKDLNEKLYNNTIVTEIVNVSAFYDAEEYHQKYYMK